MPHQFGANNAESVLATCHMAWQETRELRSMLRIGPKQTLKYTLYKLMVLHD